MKLTSTLMTCLLASGAIAMLQAQDIKLNMPASSTPPAPAATAPAAPAAAAPAAKFTDAQLLEEYGWFIGKRVGLSDLNFSPAQIDLVIKGITEASQGKPSPNELDKIGPLMDDFVKGKQNEYLAKLRAAGRAESADFLSKLKKQPGVTVLPSGLCYEIAAAGAGPSPKVTDTVTVNYTGKLIDGSVFSASTPGEPVALPLSQMIPGWTEGLQKIAKGGKIRLYIPPDLAFGDEPRQGIPPASTLVFDIELIDIQPTPPAPVAPAPAPAATTSPLEANPAAPGK